MLQEGRAGPANKDARHEARTRHVACHSARGPKDSQGRIAFASILNVPVLVPNCSETIARGCALSEMSSRGAKSIGGRILRLPRARRHQGIELIVEV